MTGSVYKCNCQCWQCQTNNHIGCESNDSVCNFNKTDVDDLTKLAWEIEKLPASEQQTKIITMLTNIRQNQPSEKKALSVEEIEKIIYRNHFKRYNGITPNDAQSHKTLAQAIESALPAQREVRYPEKDYCGKRKTALHKDNCEECKYHKLRNKLIDEFKKLNGG